MRLSVSSGKVVQNTISCDDSTTVLPLHNLNPLCNGLASEKLHKIQSLPTTTLQPLPNLNPLCKGLALAQFYKSDQSRRILVPRLDVFNRPKVSIIHRICTGCLFQNSQLRDHFTRPSYCSATLNFFKNYATGSDCKINEFCIFLFNLPFSSAHSTSIIKFAKTVAKNNIFSGPKKKKTLSSPPIFPF